MSEVTRMYELLYEERWDEKKQKERRNEAAFFSPESPITREIPIEELFDVLDAGVWAYPVPCGCGTTQGILLPPLSYRPS